MSIIDTLVPILWQAIYPSYFNGGTTQNITPRVRIAYDSNQNVSYMGFARRGITDAQSGWLIVRFTLDVNDNATHMEFAALGSTSIWDDRTTLTYA